MDSQKIRQLLQEYRDQKISQEEILEALEKNLIENLDFANIDHHRTVRQGFPEVVFCLGKTAGQIEAIVGKLLEKTGRILATHADESIFQQLQKKYPELLYHSQARCIHSTIPQASDQTRFKAGILTAGTSDLPVAEEAVLTLRMLGHEPFLAPDVGVAGIHRLQKYWKQIEKTAVLIVVAGMEGALPSVVGGLVDKPVIAVPTSIGYGIHLQGITPLLAMLNSCASNVTVVNINNGFGAAFTAGMFLRQISRIQADSSRRVPPADTPGKSEKK